MNDEQMLVGKVLIYGQEPKLQGHWDILVNILKQGKRYRLELGDHYVDC